MSRKKPPDEPGQDVEFAAIACLVISDVLLDIADRAFGRRRDGSQAGEFAVWLAECYEEMSTGVPVGEIAELAAQELPDGEPAAEAIAWVAEQLDHEAAYLRGDALTPGPRRSVWPHAARRSWSGCCARWLPISRKRAPDAPPMAGPRRAHGRPRVDSRAAPSVAST